MQTNKKPGWVQSSSEMLAGLLGGINAVVAWLIILCTVVAGALGVAFINMDNSPFASGVAGLVVVIGMVVLGLVFAALLCGLVAMLYVIMKQSQYQSWLLQQMLNRQTLKA